MRNVVLITMREFYELFATPAVWAMATLFQLLAGVRFSSFIYVARYADLEALHMVLASILILFLPIVTAGRIAQERRQGTMEMLLTSPLSPWELVGGKFLGLMGFVGLLVGLSLQYPLLLS